MVATATIGTWAIQAEDAPAQIARLIANALLEEGVVDVAGDSFKVEEDTGSNMQIKVGSGTVGDLCVIDGDAVAVQGTYVGQHANATQTLVVAASDASDDRIDRVIARVYDDDADSSGNSYMDIEVLTGTPAGSPTAPALPSGAISLATIEVDASVTAVTNADITDLRAEAQIRDEALPSAVAFTPTLTASVTDPTLGTGGTITGRYIKLGKLVMCWVEINFGTSGTNAGSGTYRVSLPVAASSAMAVAEQLYKGDVVGSGGCRDDSTATGSRQLAVQMNTVNNVILTIADGTNSIVTSAIPFAWAASDTIYLSAVYEAAA
jgi:hypothetical protein